MRTPRSAMQRSARNNEVGVSYMIGGGSRFPSHVVGILTDTRKDVVVAVSDRGPGVGATDLAPIARPLQVRAAHGGLSLLARLTSLRELYLSKYHAAQRFDP